MPRPSFEHDFLKVKKAQSLSPSLIFVYINTIIYIYIDILFDMYIAGIMRLMTSFQ